MSPHQTRRVASPARNSVSEVRGWVSERVRRGEVVIRGERVAPRSSGNMWSFDLAAGASAGVEYLPCVIWANLAPGLDARLRQRGSTLEHAMSEGMVLTVRGTLWLNAEGIVGVQVTGIEPGFVRRGDLYLEGERAIAALRTAGVHSSRLRKSFTHDNPKFAFRDIGFKPQRVMVLGPANAQGVGDLKRRLSNSAGSLPEVTYRAFSWTAGSDIRAFHTHLQEAQRLDVDLVLLVQGGGHWSKLRGYQRADLAVAIQRSSVPVATAVGHDVNVSLADRAARLSFATPTAAAEAIANVVDLGHWQRKKDAGEAAARKRRETERAARVSLLGEMASLETMCADAWHAANLAQREQSEAVARLCSASKIHNRDLLEMAEARVLLISRVVSAATLMAVAMIVVVSHGILAPFQSNQNSLQAWLAVAAVIVMGCGLLDWQRRARKIAWLRSVSGMKHPPVDVDSWRSAVKKVRTIRKLRQLRHHAPL